MKNKVSFSLEIQTIIYGEKEIDINDKVGITVAIKGGKKKKVDLGRNYANVRFKDWLDNR